MNRVDGPLRELRFEFLRKLGPKFANPSGLLDQGLSSPGWSSPKVLISWVSNNRV